MEISEAIERGVKAQWRHDLINMLTDAEIGRAHV